MNQFGDKPPVPIETLEHPPRNLLSHPEETKAALIRIEGGDWLKSHESAVARGSLDHTFVGALDWLKKDPSSFEAYIIYGAGGWNRWHVTHEGEVILIRSSSNAKIIEQAKKEGFRVDG